MSQPAPGEQSSTFERNSTLKVDLKRTRRSVYVLPSLLRGVQIITIWILEDALFALLPPVPAVILLPLLPRPNIEIDPTPLPLPSEWDTKRGFPAPSSQAQIRTAPMSYKPLGNGPPSPNLPRAQVSGRRPPDRQRPARHSPARSPGPSSSREQRCGARRTWRPALSLGDWGTTPP